MASRTDICENLPSLRCVSCICRQGLLLAGLLAFLPCTCFQGFVAFFGLPCFVFALFFFRFSFLCCGLVHFSSPFLFCDGVLGIRNGHFCFSLFSPLFRFRLCSLRLGTFRVSCPFCKTSSPQPTHFRAVGFAKGRRSSKGSRVCPSICLSISVSLSLYNLSTGPPRLGGSAAPGR